MAGDGTNEILWERNVFRSGTILYRPNNRETCCPAYTIRCDALNFRISKSQRKVLKNLNNFLKTGEVHKNESFVPIGADCRGDCSTDLVEFPKTPQNPKPQPYGDTEAASFENKLTLTARSGSARRRRWQQLQHRMAERAKKSNAPYEEILEVYFISRLMTNIFCRIISFVGKDV